MHRRGQFELMKKITTLCDLYIFTAVGKREYCADVISHNDSSFQIVLPLSIELI